LENSLFLSPVISEEIFETFWRRWTKIIVHCLQKCLKYFFGNDMEKKPLNFQKSRFEDSDSFQKVTSPILVDKHQVKILIWYLENAFRVRRVSFVFWKIPVGEIIHKALVIKFKTTVKSTEKIYFKHSCCMDFVPWQLHWCGLVRCSNFNPHISRISWNQFYFRTYLAFYLFSTFIGADAKRGPD